MSTSRVLPLLIAVVLVLGAGAFWLLNSSGSPAAAAGAPQPQAAPVAAAPTPELEGPAVLATPTSDSEAPVTAGLRQAAVSVRQLDVHLALPVGAPLDPTLAVLAVPSSLLEEHTVHALLEALRVGEESEEQVVRATVEGALELHAPGARARAIFPLGLAIAGLTLAAYPRQLSPHPLRADVREQKLEGGVIHDAHYHRLKPDLDFSPWELGSDAETLSPDEAARLFDVHGEPPPVRALRLATSMRATSPTCAPSTHRTRSPTPGACACSSASTNG